MEWEVGVSRYKLLFRELSILCIKWGPTIEPRDLYSISYNKYFNIAYICITKSLYCTTIINTTLYINYTSIFKRRKNFFFYFLKSILSVLNLFTEHSKMYPIIQSIDISQIEHIYIMQFRSTGRISLVPRKIPYVTPYCISDS